MGEASPWIMLHIILNLKYLSGAGNLWHLPLLGKRCYSVGRLKPTVKRPAAGWPSGDGSVPSDGLGCGPPAQPPAPLSGSGRCKEARVPGGLGAELQMSGPARPLSARVMHEVPTAPRGLRSHHLLRSSSEVAGRSK